jgi:hypothetical protein
MRSAVQVVIDQQRGEQQRQVDDREAEGAARERVGVARQSRQA